MVSKALRYFKKLQFFLHQAEHCTVLPDMDASCKPVTIRKKIRIPIKECKGQRVIQKCFQIVGAICQQNQPNCRMVPRQVCKDTCEENDYCNTCNNFVNQGGFGKVFMVKTEKKSYLKLSG